MKAFKLTLEKFNYKFPSDLIATSPARPRDSARLLVYNQRKREINFDTFKNLLKYLPKNSVLIFNKTKVIPARLEVKKQTGGKASILYIGTENGLVKVISNRKLVTGSRVFICSKCPFFHGREKTDTYNVSKNIYFIVKKHYGNFYLLKPSFSVKKIFAVLEKYGYAPLPPYIKNPPLSQRSLKREYQTVFAKTAGSVAAPTASLHFTKKLLAKIKKAGHKIYFITLHVNLGTFAPLTPDNLKTQTLHTEHWKIDKGTARKLNLAKKQGKNIIAVGTTVVRTLESAANTSGKLVKFSGNTNLFINEKSKLHFVDSIITNFHVPGSSLLMLVSAFIGRKKLFKLYNLAIQKKFRLFSFGDGMLII